MCPHFYANGTLLRLLPINLQLDQSLRHIYQAGFHSVRMQVSPDFHVSRYLPNCRPTQNWGWQHDQHTMPRHKKQHLSRTPPHVPFTSSNYPYDMSNGFPTNPMTLAYQTQTRLMIDLSGTFTGRSIFLPFRLVNFESWRAPWSSYGIVIMLEIIIESCFAYARCALTD